MMDFLQKSIEKTYVRFFQSRRRLAIGGVGLLAGVVAWHTVFGANGFVVYQQKRSESHRLEQDILRLQQDNTQRQEKIRALTSDPQAIEKEARERLKYARKGEVIYTLPQSKPNSAEKK
jgi:cell division protein FtsB